MKNCTIIEKHNPNDMALIAYSTDGQALIGKMYEKKEAFDFAIESIKETGCVIESPINYTRDPNCTQFIVVNGGQIIVEEGSNSCEFQLIFAESPYSWYKITGKTESKGKGFEYFKKTVDSSNEATIVLSCKESGKQVQFYGAKDIKILQLTK